MNYTKGIIEIQRRIFAQTKRRTDAHYREGYGALFVFEGALLVPQNIVYGADEMELTLLSL